jgi:hypothetical protein
MEVLSEGSQYVLEVLPSWEKRRLIASMYRSPPCSHSVPRASSWDFQSRIKLEAISEYKENQLFQSGLLPCRI